MKREKVDLSLYNRVDLVDCDDVTHRGWIVPIHRNEYAILYNDDDLIYVFRASQIKSITYIRNGYTLR